MGETLRRCRTPAARRASTPLVCGLIDFTSDDTEVVDRSNCCISLALKRRLCNASPCCSTTATPEQLCFPIKRIYKNPYLSNDCSIRVLVYLIPTREYTYIYIYMSACVCISVRLLLCERVLKAEKQFFIIRIDSRVAEGEHLQNIDYYIRWTSYIYHTYMYVQSETARPSIQRTGTAKDIYIYICRGVSTACAVYKDTVRVTRLVFLRYIRMCRREENIPAAAAAKPRLAQFLPKSSSLYIYIYIYMIYVDLYMNIHIDIFVHVYVYMSP